VSSVALRHVLNLLLCLGGQVAKFMANVLHSYKLSITMMEKLDATFTEARFQQKYTDLDDAGRLLKARIWTHGKCEEMNDIVRQ
jgi:hypothetical protein